MVPSTRTEPPRDGTANLEYKPWPSPPRDAAAAGFLAKAKFSEDVSSLDRIEIQKKHDETCFDMIDM